MVLSMIAFCLCSLGRNSPLLEDGIFGLEKLLSKIDLLLMRDILGAKAEGEAHSHITHLELRVS